MVDIGARSMKKKKKKIKFSPNVDTLKANSIMVAKQGLLGLPINTCTSADINDLHQRANIRTLHFIPNSPKPKKKKKS
jgi:hypothetical protein